MAGGPSNVFSFQGARSRIGKRGADRAVRVSEADLGLHH